MTEQIFNFITECNKKNITKIEDFNGNVELGDDLYFSIRDIATESIDKTKLSEFKFNWTISGFKQEDIFTKYFESAVKRSITFADSSAIEFPIFMDMGDEEAFQDFGKILFKYYDFIQSVNGVIYPIGYREGCGASPSAMRTLKAKINEMELYNDAGEISNVGNYLLCDISYPDVSNIEMKELISFRNDEGILFRQFNREIYKLISNLKSKKFDTEKAIIEIFEEVSDKVSELKIESEKISRKSNILKFEWSKFGIYSLLFFGSTVGSSLGIPIDPNILESLKIASGIIGTGQATDLVKGYSAKKDSKLDLKRNPYYWAYTLNEKNENAT